MSSDSSDDEDLAKLQEAADSQFINDQMFEKKKDIPKEDPIKTQPSLRQSTYENDNFNSPYLTPQFRKSVAKHLTQFLENTLQYTKKNYEPHTKPKRRKSGIKLFYNSPHFIKIRSKELATVARPVIVDTFDENVEEEKCRLVSVSAQDILSKKETLHWSNRSKAPVYSYVNTKQGLILK